MVMHRPAIDGRSAFLTATVTSYFVSSEQERAKANELEQREAADKELRELLRFIDTSERGFVK